MSTRLASVRFLPGADLLSHCFIDPLPDKVKQISHAGRRIPVGSTEGATTSLCDRDLDWSQKILEILMSVSAIGAPLATHPAPAITDPRLQCLYDYWSQKRGKRLAPRREDMEAKDFKNILPIIYILDVVGPPPYRFRFRLTGTRFVEEYGEDVVGKFADQIDLDDHEKLILAEYGQVARDGQPSSTKWDYTKRDGRHLSYEHLILPLSSDGAKIDMLFGAADMKGVG